MQTYLNFANYVFGLFDECMGNWSQNMSDAALVLSGVGDFEEDATGYMDAGDSAQQQANAFQQQHNQLLAEIQALIAMVDEAIDNQEFELAAGYIAQAEAKQEEANSKLVEYTAAQAVADDFHNQAANAFTQATNCYNSAFTVLVPGMDDIHAAMECLDAIGQPPF